MLWDNHHQKIAQGSGGFDEDLDFGEDTDYIERIGAISQFRVLRTPKLLVSTRRVQEEGLRNVAFKYAKSTFYQFRADR
jgi:hypothetical protein